MSRIGKAPIVLPANVTVEVSDSNYVTVTGPKGKLEQQITGNVSVTRVEQDGKQAILFQRVFAHELAAEEAQSDEIHAVEVAADDVEVGSAPREVVVHVRH